MSAISFQPSAISYQPKNEFFFCFQSITTSLNHEALILLSTSYAGYGIEQGLGPPSSRMAGLRRARQEKVILLKSYRIVKLIDLLYYDDFCSYYLRYDEVKKIISPERCCHED